MNTDLSTIDEKGASADARDASRAAAHEPGNVRSRTFGCGFVSTLALLLSSAAPAWAQSSAAAPATPRAVTLVTGDQVLVSGPDASTVGIRRAPGREQVRFTTHHIRLPDAPRSHLLVIPEDAAPLIAAGKVDRRLFDVTLLLEYEYDDAHRDSLPLIVTYERSALAARGARAVPGAVAQRQLSSVNGMALSSPKASVRDVWRTLVSGGASSGSAPQATAIEPVGKLWLDGLLRPVLDRSVPQIGAPEAWALGYEGDGVLVAVLDTGVDDTHPDLADRVIATRNFTIESDQDLVGHGTHVASTIAGSGAADGGLRRGVAPGALLLSGKVCEEFFCPESSIIAGMQWAVAEEGARIVNMSLSGGDALGYDPLEEALSTLAAQYGALFVVAAGNAGPDVGSVGSPGTIPAALTVGAVDRDEQVALFSSRGMTLDGAIKPDLTGPGVDIVAARAAGTELGEPVGDDYVTLSGTSMATPHVAGAAALLLDQHPSWGLAELKSALIGSASYNPAFTARDQGGGRVDVGAALDANLLASAPNLSFGVARWPHDDDAPVVRTVTYRNLGPAAELTVELDVTGPDGAPVPEGMFRVEPSTLSVPEGGSASVRVTADTRAGSVDGIFGGRLIVSDGEGRSQAVPIAVEREVESYELALQHIDRQGQPAQSYFTFLMGGDPFVYRFIGSGPESEAPLRLPRGHYLLETFVDDAAGIEPFTLLVTPDAELVADTVLELDARIAAPASISAPGLDAEPRTATLSYDTSNASVGLSSGIGMAFTTPIFYGGVVEPGDPEMTSSLHVDWENSSSSPVSVYAAAWGDRGRLTTGELVAAVDQFAVVHARFAGYLGTSLPFNDVYMAPIVPGSGGYSYSPLRVEFPHERLEHYYSGNDEFAWISGYWSHDEDYTQNFLVDGAPTRYLPGQSYESRWNEPVFSAQVPDAQAFTPFVNRRGDVLQLAVGNYSDRAGHAGYLQTEGRARLYRNGELFAESEFPDGGIFEVPPELASYRFELDNAQTLFELTTEQRLVWTFQSAHVEGDAIVRPPVLTARFEPVLSASGRAPRGAFCLPFRIARNGQGTAHDVGTPGLEVSYDDGGSWAAAVVRKAGRGFEALLDHPADAPYVSLRASAHDADGNTVEQTLIRAYGLADAP